MTAILLHLDEAAGNEYENFSIKTKQQFALEVSMLIKNIACDARAEKLNKLIEDINNDQDSMPIDSELLLKLLQID